MNRFSCLFLSIFLGGLFSSCLIEATKLMFVNQCDQPFYVKLEGWKRIKWFRLQQEKERKVEPGKSLTWAPTFKPHIYLDQSKLYIYDKNKRLYDIIVLKSYKGYTVPAGHVRKIGFRYKGHYQDLVERKGRALSNFLRVTTDLLEKAREVFLDIFHKVIGPERAKMRNVRNPKNPVPYDIIQKNPYAQKEARMRVGGPIACDEEKAYFYRRQQKIKEAQKSFLDVTFTKDEKPLVVAFAASGGGERARFLAIGSTIGAEKMGLLDCATYFSTLSGSTWFLSSWLDSGMDLQAYAKRAVDEAKRGLVPINFKKNMKDFGDILLTKFAFAHSINVIDMFGALLGIRYLRGLGEGSSSQRCYLSSFVNKSNFKNGQSIIPIFTAVTAEIGLTHKWCCFTPWEFGSRWFGKSGAYIPTWSFGRKFKNKISKNWGTKDKPLYGVRSTLPFLMAIWGSAIAATAGQMYDTLISSMKPSPIKTILHHFMKETDLKRARIIWAEVYNPMYKQPSFGFSKYKYLKLADAGCKLGCPIFVTYRRPQEGESIKNGAAPDVIVLFHVSDTIDSGELLAQEKYARKHNLPFPKIDYKDIDKKLVSVFTQNPDPARFKDYEVPTVIYLPRIKDLATIEKYKNDSRFKDIIEKIIPFNIEKCVKKTCASFNFKYPKNIAESLLALSEFNIRVVADKIKEAMRKRLELNRKRDQVLAK